MTYLVFASVVLLVLALIEYRRERNQTLIERNDLLAKYTDSHAKFVNEQKANIGITTRLLIAKGTLNDIANQNHGDRAFEIWARKRATDTVALVEG